MFRGSGRTQSPSLKFCADLQGQASNLGDWQRVPCALPKVLGTGNAFLVAMSSVRLFKAKGPTSFPSGSIDLSATQGPESGTGKRGSCSLHLNVRLCSVSMEWRPFLVTGTVVGCQADESLLIRQTKLPYGAGSQADTELKVSLGKRPAMNNFLQRQLSLVHLPGHIVPGNLATGLDDLGQGRGISGHKGDQQGMLLQELDEAPM